MARELVATLPPGSLLLVKDNQSALRHDVTWLFAPPSGREQPVPLLDQRTTQTVERGHVRTYDRRVLTATTDLTGYSDWPGLTQVFQLERSWRTRIGAKHTLHYGITSLPPEVAGPERLLALKRDHWQIENELHYIKEVTLGEDRSLIHVGQGPVALVLGSVPTRAQALHPPLPDLVRVRGPRYAGSPPNWLEQEHSHAPDTMAHDGRK